MNPKVEKLMNEFQNYGLKRMTAKGYAAHVIRFCNRNGITENDLLNLPLEQIEDLTERFIKSNMRRLSPKELNNYYASIKAYLVMKRKIKSTREFRQIKFDGQSRKTRDREMITREIMRQACDNTDVVGKLVLTFYGVNGLRPSIIPQLKVGNIRKKDIKFNADGTVKLAPKTWIWIWREYEGNKARIDFPIILTDEQRKWLEDHLNQRIRYGEVINDDTQLLAIGQTADCVYKIVKRLLRKVGFNGRTYLLRHYAFKQLKRAVEDYDFREWLMGHKGRISAIYDHEHYLDDREIEEYKMQYDQTKLLIYGATTEEMRQAELLAGFARNLGVSDDKIAQILNLLKTGQLTAKQFEQRLNQIVQKHLEQQIEDKFEELFVKLNRKYNGQ